MSEVRKGRVDIIAIYKLDRLGRSLQHLAQLIGELKTHRTALVSTSRGIDTSESNSASRLQMNVLLAVAEFERDAIIERINADLAAAPARSISPTLRIPNPRFSFPNPGQHVQCRMAYAWLFFSSSSRRHASNVGLLMTSIPGPGEAQRHFGAIRFAENRKLSAFSCSRGRLP